MQLEDYFDFIQEPCEQIRLKGRRINLENIITLYNQGMIPEQIAIYFAAPLSVEQVYASITYYLHNKEAVEGYMDRVQVQAKEAGDRYLSSLSSEEKQRRENLSERLRAAKKERELAKKAAS